MAGEPRALCDQLKPVELTTIANFPAGYFLENLAVCADGSILVTALTQKELWYLPPPTTNLPVDPKLVCAFDYLATGIVEAEPGIFYVSTTDGYSTRASALTRLDLRGWTPGTPVTPEVVLQFPEPVGGLNGSCLIAPGVMLLADSFAGLIWRVDLPTSHSPAASAHIWLRHPTMAHDPDSTLTPPQPGINGIRYAGKTHTLYYTSTAQKLFMRVRVDPRTHDPLSEPELVASGAMSDDFCIDEDAAIAYVTTHRENTIDVVHLDSAPQQHRTVLIGDPFTEQVVGPSSCAWARNPGDHGRIAYITTDGGTTALPPDGILRPAMVLRMTLPNPGQPHT
jgi:sugar lactone lactonase YvrE